MCEQSYDLRLEEHSRCCGLGGGSIKLFLRRSARSADISQLRRRSRECGSDKLSLRASLTSATVRRQASVLPRLTQSVRRLTSSGRDLRLVVAFPRTFTHQRRSTQPSEACHTFIILQRAPGVLLAAGFRSGMPSISLHDNGAAGENRKWRDRRGEMSLANVAVGQEMGEESGETD